MQELLDLHTKLQASEDQHEQHNFGIHTPGEHVTASQPQGQIQDTTDQDMVWSWMMNDDGDLRGLHPDTIQSVIDGLNVESMDLPNFNLQYDYNIWGARSLGTNPSPMT